MLEVRIHGLGGQGVVQTAHLVGNAGVRCGRWALSFPFFSTAIRGGLVTAFVRIDDSPVDNRSYIYEPLFLAVFDASLLQLEEVVRGLQPEARLVVSCTGGLPQLPGGFRGQVYTLNGNGIAQATLGRPILSTVMAGAIAKVSGQVSLEHLQGAIEGSFAARLVPANLQAAEAGYSHVKLFEGS